MGQERVVLKLIIPTSMFHLNISKIGLPLSNLSPSLAVPSAFSFLPPSCIQNRNRRLKEDKKDN
tara:strand:+ start:475 stop:666 length:192 start_codon:yes stop_codon:yes gene_type:complete